MTQDWEARYRSSSVDETAAAAVLQDNAHLLPPSGVALDVACGLGGNAVYLARRGLDTFAWDSEPTAIDKLAAWVQEQSLPVTAEVRDVLESPPEPGRFDVITVTRFLERDLVPHLVAALRPGGVLFYQTFTLTHVNERGPGSDRFRLADGELLRLFSPLHVLFYREEGKVGDTTRGFRDEAQLVAWKAPA